MSFGFNIPQPVAKSRRGSPVPSFCSAGLLSASIHPWSNRDDLIALIGTRNGAASRAIWPRTKHSHGDGDGRPFPPLQFFLQLLYGFSLHLGPRTPSISQLTLALPAVDPPPACWSHRRIGALARQLENRPRGYYITVGTLRVAIFRRHPDARYKSPYTYWSASNVVRLQYQ
jgi:hypothetical protein